MVIDHVTTKLNELFDKLLPGTRNSEARSSARSFL